jgi:hypothetical protein
LGNQLIKHQATTISARIEYVRVHPKEKDMEKDSSPHRRIAGTEEAAHDMSISNTMPDVGMTAIEAMGLEAVQRELAAYQPATSSAVVELEAHRERHPAMAAAARHAGRRRPRAAFSCSLTGSPCDPTRDRHIISPRGSS